MIQIAQFTFSMFQENTYVLYDESKECVIIDPGCYDNAEEKELADFIASAGLRPLRLLNTHCHLDHIFGNDFVSRTYDLPVECHKGELPVLEQAPMVANMYGIPMTASPAPGRFITEGETIDFGESQLRVLFTPGHSPASVCFFCEKERFVIAGDTLFQMSIGRTDLPGGDAATLLRSIKEELLPLGDDVRVYPGHNNPTNIGYERKNNPFLQ